MYECKKIRLRTYSPIHIGNELGKISKFEFIIDKNYIYPISEERLANFLLEKNLVDSYISEIDQKGRNFDLLSFLKQKRITLTNNDYIYLSNGRKIRALQNISSLVEFHPIIRDGFANPYIPGTSLKGSIRTAILYDYLKKTKEANNQNFNNYVNRIESSINKGKKKKEFDEFIIKDVFQNFNIQQKKESPNTDWLRMLHVSDAYPVRLKETILIPANILKKENNNFVYRLESNNQPTAIWVECFPENTIFEFEIRWDIRLLSEFKSNNALLPKSIDDVFTCLKNWSHDIIQFERNFALGNPLANWYEDKSLNFRVGFGSGMISTTIAMLLEEDLRKRIRNYAGLNRGNQEAPKSRRVFKKDNINIPFGWGYIEKEPFVNTVIQNILETMPEDVSQARIEEPPPQSMQEIIINNATITYNPSRGEITAEGEGIKTAPKKITDRSFVPEVYHKKLFEKKEKITAKVTVKKIGNLVEIFSIEQL